MDLEELYNNCPAEQIKDIIYDYLMKPLSFRAKYGFEDYIEELKKCSNQHCENIEEKDKMFDTERKVDGGVGLVCESCYNDMKVN